MLKLGHLLVSLKRITHCRGFGIQSPTDYWLVRYVINEHWPYYQYETLGQDDDWLTRKLGRLYFRIANWRQAAVIESDAYRDYLKAGCNRASFGDESSELIILTMQGDYHSRMNYIYNKVCDGSVLVIDGIRHDRAFWRQVMGDERTAITFDLYYCGIVLFDKKRHQQHYVINF